MMMLAGEDESIILYDLKENIPISTLNNKKTVNEKIVTRCYPALDQVWKNTNTLTV